MIPGHLVITQKESIDTKKSKKVCIEMVMIYMVLLVFLGQLLANLACTNNVEQ